MEDKRWCRREWRPRAGDEGDPQHLALRSVADNGRGSDIVCADRANYPGLSQRSVSDDGVSAKASDNSLSSSQKQLQLSSWAGAEMSSLQPAPRGSAASVLYRTGGDLPGGKAESNAPKCR